MKTKLFFVIILFVTFFIGCSEDESTPTQPTVNPFAGNWQVVFAGDYTGGGNMNINDEGKFSVNVVLTGTGGTFTNTISGTVSSSGSMSADIFYSGSKIGTCSGTFSGNAGSGSYQTSQPSNGTWSATR